MSRTAILLCLSSLAAPGACWAAEVQAPTSAAPAPVAEVVVSAPAQPADVASKTATPVIELPRSVSVVTQEELRLRSPDTVVQALQYSAGFNGQLNGRARERGYPYVRGFLAFEYMDGLKMLDRNWAIEPFGLDSIELLRGPASSLYGQAAPGGLVELESKRPTAARAGEIYLEGGSYSRLEGGLDVTGGLDDGGRFLGRLTFMGRKAQTEQVFTHDDRIYVAPAFTWNVDAATRLTLLASYQKDPNFNFINYSYPAVGTLTASKFGYVSRSVFPGDPNYDDNSHTQTAIGYLFHHDFGHGLSLDENARFTEVTNDLHYFSSFALAADQRTFNRRIVNVHEYQQVAQVDTHLNALFRTGPLDHTAIAGVDYASLPYAQASGTGAGVPLDLYNPVYGVRLVAPALTTKRDQEQNQTGLYAQDQVAWGALRLILGGRHDWAHQATITTTVATGAKAAQIVTDNTKDTGQASLLYELPFGLSPYVTYSTSFYPVSGVSFSGASFQPTTGEGEEVGLKFKPPGVSALITAAVYHLVQQNVLTADPAHTGYSIQTGEVRSQGIELEAKGEALPHLNVIASYTHDDARVTRSNTVSLGKRPFAVPLDQAALWADYAFGPHRAVTLGAGFTFYGETFGDAGNTFRVPSYTLWDSTLRIDLSGFLSRLRGVTVQVNALNMLDKRYVSACDASNDCFYGLSRTIKASIHKAF